MWRNPRIQTLFQIEHPILQAPMAGSSNAQATAAASNAGALGSFGAAPTSPDALRKVIHEIRQQTDQPFNINLFAPGSEQFDSAALPNEKFKQKLTQYHDELGLGELPQPKGLFGPSEQQLEVLIEEKVPVISFHFGIEARHVSAIHEAGLKVICSATTVAEAIHLEQLGVDAIIAQGGEAGGHRGTFLGEPNDALIGTLALVPAIVDRVSVPVIAAGGIMDGRGMVACAALGASAVQLGTAFLGCKETPISDVWRDNLASSDADRTTVTRVVSGKPARGLKTRYITEIEALNEPLLPYPLQYSMSGPLRAHAIRQNVADFSVMWSGQGVSLYRSTTIAELIHQLVSEAQDARIDVAP